VSSWPGSRVSVQLHHRGGDLVCLWGSFRSSGVRVDPHLSPVPGGGVLVVYAALGELGFPLVRVAVP
jgi:hypothetical protein